MRAAVSAAWRHCGWAITAAETTYPAYNQPLQPSLDLGCFTRQHARLVHDTSERMTLENRETGRIIRVLGVAHASEKSADAVRSFIQEVQPQVVVLPLCTMRYLALSQNKPLLPDEVFQFVKEQGDAAGTQFPGYSADHAQHVLKAVLKGIGFEPGPSMKAASQAAHDLGATIELAEPPVDSLVKASIDAAEQLRDSGTTLVQRAGQARGQLAEFAAALREESGMSFRGGDFREMAQLAKISRRRTARAAVDVARKIAPEVAEVLIDRRDAAIGRKLLEYSANDIAERRDFNDDDGKGPTIVAILGISQLDGVKQNFFSNYIDEGALFEQGIEGAKPHSNLFEVPPVHKDTGGESNATGGEANAAGWRRMFGLSK